MGKACNSALQGQKNNEDERRETAMQDARDKVGREVAAWGGDEVHQVRWSLRLAISAGSGEKGFCLTDVSVVSLGELA